MSASTELLNVEIDGVWHQFPKGTRVIEACAQAGKFVPHYCYHPKLSSPGNCRMCLIEMGMPKLGPDRKPQTGEDGKPLINWIPRPQISCAQDIAEGMGVRTDSPLVRECRNGVMEFLLINHPLDCPICDQAGECQLQEFSVQYGTGGSRFLEEKVKKPKRVELGPRVTLDDERCILCSRCIRFMKEVAKDDVLGFASRGSHTYLTAHPGRRLDSNYSLNTVDICPVGALTNTDFRFKMRVWFLKETKSICTSCATGCNTIIGSRQNVIYRQTPRENDRVNSSWMCDYGRLNFHYVNAPERLTKPRVRLTSGQQDASWTTAIARAVDDLRRFTSDEIAVIGSGKMTNEELWLTKKLIDALEIKYHDIVPRIGESDEILLSSFRNPNLVGAHLFGVAQEEPGSLLPEIFQRVKAGSIKAVLALSEDLSSGLTEGELNKLEALIVVDILPNRTAAQATTLLPGYSFAEKRGSMINIKARLQRLNRAIHGPGEARDDWEILRDLLQKVTGSNGIYLIEDVFKQMADGVPELHGLSLSKIGDLGVQLEDKSAQTAAPESVQV
ncbi:MAG TPA: molybdopterin-dependent oxidoreductase [Chthoniobacterales bacterium]|nr:molybdopterin-dependent oxidoreductase [Chthoniobacterales bacterium]